MRLGTRIGNPLRPGGERGVVVAVAALAVFVGYLLLAHVALLFQNLFQSTYLLIPGARLAHDYWQSVDYGIGMAVLVGMFTTLLLLIIAIEVYRIVGPRRFR